MASVGLTGGRSRCVRGAFIVVRGFGGGSGATGVFTREKAGPAGALARHVAAMRPLSSATDERGRARDIRGSIAQSTTLSRLDFTSTGGLAHAPVNGLKRGLHASSSSSQVDDRSEQSEELNSNKQEKSALLGKDMPQGALDSGGKESDKNRETLKRIVKLALPEAQLIGASMGSLLVTSSISLIFPAAIGKILDLSLTDGTGLTPTYVAGGLMGLFVVQGAFVVGRSAMLSVAGERLIARFRKQLFRSILAQDMAFFDTTRTGELINRLSSDTQLVQKSVTGNVVSGLRSVFMAVGGTGMLFYTSPWLALVSLSVIPPVGLAARRFGRVIKKRQSEVQDALADTSSVAEEVIANMRTVRQFGGEPVEAAKYDARIDTAYRKAANVGLSTAWFDGSVHLAANFSLVAVLGYGGSLVMSQEITAGALTSFLMYSLYVGFNITNLSTVYSDLMRGVGASSRIFDIIDRVPTMPSSITSAAADPSGLGGGHGTCQASVDPARLPPSVLAHIQKQIDGPGVLKSEPYGAALFGLTPDNTDARNSEETGTYHTPFGTQVTARSGFDSLADSVNPTLSRPKINGRVDLVDVAFSYPMRPDSKVLDGLNLQVPRGTSLAIVGSSGSGKSTIAALLTRLYDPERGRVLVDGVDVREIDPHWLRRHIGVVQQEAQLFSGTIEENIRYGALADEADFADVETAARQANAHEFIERFPDGYQTMVGERGLSLSGGQKQRIAIARALLTKPKLLLLDEATSALDTVSESLVQDALEKITVGAKNKHAITSVVISHRMSTISSCDSIAVLDKGKLVQQGTHQELLQDVNGVYAQLVTKQLKP